MNYEQWESAYKPIANHFDNNASMDGMLFETYGEELSFVRNQNAKCIWTLLDADGDLIIASGYHYVDRVGYFITENTFKVTTIEVNLEE